MVSQTKDGARGLPAAAGPAGRKWLQKDATTNGRVALDEQASAAAIVDADQSQVPAATRIMTTDAPSDGLSLMAQSTETPPDPPSEPSTTSTAGATPPPQAEEPAGLAPWIVGGASVLVFGAVAAIVDNNGDDNDDAVPPVAQDPAPEDPVVTPPVVTPPAMPPAVEAPANTAPTSPPAATVVTQADGTTALSASNFPFADADTGDALAKVRIDSVTSTQIETLENAALAINPASGGHGYELVTGALTWEAARAAAEARGGYLAILNSEAEALFIKAEFELGGGGPPGGPFDDGAWVGARQAAIADPLATGAGWTWVDGSALPADSPFWTGVDAPADFNRNGNTFAVEDGEAQFGAVFETFGGSGVDVPDILYDYGSATETVARYLIEYDNPNAPLTLNGTPVLAGQEIAAADLGGLTWNSVFNSGGTVTFAVSDGDAYSAPGNTLTLTAPAAQVTSLSALIDDQNSNNPV